MLKLFKTYPYVLLFGILTAIFSGPGQTFLVSLFIPFMRESFSMNQTEIAGIYSVATLISSLLLPFMGNLLDRAHLTKFTLGAGFLLAFGCILLSVSQGWVMLVIGFLLIRNLGQGTLCMVSSTTMARTFGKHRGKALSIANLGYPLSESFFPILISTWILSFGWRSGWMLLAALVILFFMPAVLFLLRANVYEKTRAKVNANQEVEKEISESFHEAVHWEFKDVMRDIRFYLLLASILATPAFLTALFFHQGSVAVWKGWSLQMIAAGFVAFAVGRGAASFFVGLLIDKFSARRLYPFALLPMVSGFFFLVFGDSLFWLFAYLAGAGLTMGAGSTISSALFAEFYGTKKLGSIRGCLSFFIVLSTAITPVIVGRFLDLRISMTFIVWGMILLTFCGTIFATVACQLPNKNRR